ncbi:T9SS type A sorting domain-containing protein, partial [Flavobacterium sp. RSB2_4_14]|uniref:T9SS type A sorting domain-containing protein n=1 Tax=Flavobacterium sp. RSB2_4_14 TaxID=3447665 RepID=UPI003F3AAD19
IYNVSIELTSYGVGPIGKDCTIKAPAASQAKPVALSFSAMALPNPFANNFMISVTTTAKESINITVYDMVGRLIEQQEVSAKTLESLPLGERYPSGVYNIVVTQGEDVKTLRVVKR